MKFVLSLVAILLFALPANAQHDDHHHEHEEEEQSTMPTAIQTGSGTSWMPGTTPSYMLMYQLGEKQHMMLHGNIALRYLTFDTPRAENSFSAPNWFMAMTERILTEHDYLNLRVMVSLDRLTEGGDGYPLLLQTGETWKGKPLVDKQHPHDVFSEIALGLTHEFSEDWMLKLYAGLPGEPALGPSAFMHRPSAMSNPDAPLGHHWQDATHISYGVFTAALSWRNLRIEGSLFNGTEPDEDRFGFDKPQFGSYSSRLSYNPTDELAFQVSGAKLKNPERNGNNVTRITASGMYTKKLSSASWWATTAVWGRNDEEHEGESQSTLLESQYTVDRHNIYGRLEIVEKFGEALAIENYDHVKFTSTSIAAGYSFNVFKFAGLDADLGAQLSYLFLPPTLKSLYGNSPYTAQVTLTIHPSLMDMMHLHR